MRAVSGAWLWRGGVCLVFGLLVMACADNTPNKEVKDKDMSDQQGAQDGPDSGASAAVDEAEEQPPKPLTVQELKPVLMDYGAKDKIPDEVVVQFAQPVVGSIRDAIDLEKTRLTITPPVRGQVKWRTTSALVFEPAQGFEPETQYTVALHSVEAFNTTLAPAAPWTHSFKTPGFNFVQMSAPVRTGPDRAEVELSFSAPLKAHNLIKEIAWSFDGKPIKEASYAMGSSPSNVRVTLIDKALGAKLADVAFNLDGAVVARTGQELRKASGKQRLVAGKQAHVQHVYAAEGTSGYYIEIICSDDAAPGDERWYYDNTIYRGFDISSRCLADAKSAKDFVHINPPLPFEVASSPGGFRIFGDFKRGAYSLSVGAGLRTEDGGVFYRPHKEQINIGARKPTINFSSKGRYLPSKAFKRVSLRHLNQDKVKLSVRHVPRANLAFWLSGSEAFDERVSNLVASQDIALKAEDDKPQTSWVDISGLVAAPEPGVYEVKATGEQYTEDSMRVVLTDLNVIAKVHAPAPEEPWADKVHVWVTDMHNANPIPGAKAELIRPSGQLMGSCQTDAQGSCAIDVSTKGADKTQPLGLIVSKGVDFTFLKYSELATPLSNTSGRPYLTSEPYEAYVYGDRDLYRPGDEGHFVAMLRTRNQVAPKENTPVEVVIRDPRSRIVRRQLTKTNAAGQVEVGMTFADFAPTGRWSLSLKVGKRTLTSYSFSVEEFVPERMRVRINAEPKESLLADPHTFKVQAKYLFGGSAQGSEVQTTCSLTPTTFSPEKNDQYTYGQDVISSRGRKRIDLGEGEAQTLDEQDEATISCAALENPAGFKGTGTITARVSVLEAGSGRATTKSASKTVHPAPYYIGLRTDASRAKAGEPVKVEGVVVDWRGEVVDQLQELDVEFMRMISEYGLYYDEDSDSEMYSAYRRPAPEGATQRVKVNKGRFTLSFTPGVDAAAFVVRASAGAIATDLEIDGDYGGYYWWYGSSQDVTPNPKAPSPVRFEAIKGDVEVGQEVELSFEAPYSGRALLSLETHKIVQSEWREVKAGKNTWKIKVNEFAPNIYASAFIIKDPYQDSKDAFMPGRAVGATSIKVRPTQYTQQLKLSVPSEIRSEQTLKILVDAGKTKEPLFLTVAAVDEGILSLSNFKTPDPNASFFSRRGLGVHTFDTVGWALMLESLKAASATGGDDDYEESDDVDAGGEDSAGLGRPKAIKPVALWSGLIKVPASGKAEVEFKLPLYRGALRVMAIAAGPKVVGRADAEVLVRDPLTIQTTMPRFLSAQDVVHVPVFVSNVSGKPREVTVSVAAEEAAIEGVEQGTLTGGVALMEVLSDKQVKLSLKDGASGNAIFTVKGLRQAGLAKLRVIAKSDELESYDEALVPFIPAGPRERLVKRVEIEAGEHDLTSMLQGWVPTSERSTFWVTSLPYGEAFDHLKFLIRYPYGCIEQTTSATRPMLFISSILQLVDPSLLPKPEALKDMVDHGIRRVLSMQTGVGGFAYWPGGDYPDAWGTAYATHMLIDAKKMGYEVPKERLDDALDWMDNNLSLSTHAHAEPYMHYVLALGERGQKARALRLLEGLQAASSKYGVHGETREALYLLKAALYMMGDHSFEAELRKPDVSPITQDRRYGYSYYSDLRSRGLMLSAFFDLFGKKAEGEALANLVGQGLAQRSSYYYTTQELVWGITGLGKWVKDSAANFEGAELWVNGLQLKPSKQLKDRPDVTWSLMRASEYKDLKLKLKNKASGTLYLVVSSEGVRQDPTLKYGGDRLDISRAYVDSAGKSVDLNNIMLGDVIYAKITLTNTSAERIDNVALVERFGAGFELENPNLGRGDVPQIFQAQLWDTQHMNLRDDRVEAFGALYPRQSVSVVLPLRATSAGSFSIPSASAEAMYDPSVWARVAPRQVKVIGPWQSDQ